MNTSHRRINLGFDRFSGVYLWAAFITIFGIWAPHTFLSMSTLHSVASEQALGGMVALAVLIPMAAGHFDLSVGANANLTGIIAIQLQTIQHWNMGAAIMAAILVGVVVGTVNAFLVVKLGISSFIATLAMSSILAAVLVIVSGSTQPQPVISSLWNNITQIQVGGFQIVVLYLIVAAFLIWYFLDFTPAGRYIYATGGNPDAARLSGVRVNRWTAITLILSGAISGLAGILYTSLTGPSLSFGATLLLPAFAAAFLGSTQLQPGKFNVWGTLIAIYALATGVEGLQFVSGQQWLDGMFDGVALVLAVALAVRRQRRPRAGGQGARAVVTESRSPDEMAPPYVDPLVATSSPEELGDMGGGIA